MFKVVKRDGCWWVLDRYGRLRYAAGSHQMALAFALIQPHHFPTLKGEVDPYGKRIDIRDAVVRKLRQQRDDVRRALESALESDPDDADE